VKYQDGEIVFDTHLEALLRGLAQWGVQEGLSVSPQTPPAMEVVVSPGVAKINQVEFSFASSTSVSISPADPDYPRKDTVVLDYTGAIRAVKGTPAPAEPAGKVGIFTYKPKPPDLPDVAVPLAEVWVNAGVTEIKDADITDRRHIVKHYITGADLAPGVIALADIRTHAYAGVEKTVTQTSETLQDSAVPADPYTALQPQALIYEANNPAGSGVWLYSRVLLLYDDLTTNEIYYLTLGEGSVEAYDFPTQYIAGKFSTEKRIKQVQLTSWVSAAPAAGYEPSVTLKKVAGFQY